MVPLPASSPAPRAASTSALEVEEYFAAQRTPSTELPPPDPLLENLTIGVLEVLGGVRDVDQLARWLGEDAYKALATRANLAARGRSARGVGAGRPQYRILSVHHSSPTDSVVEAVVVVTMPARTRSVAVRLEGWDGRWRATSIALL